MVDIGFDLPPDGCPPVGEGGPDKIIHYLLQFNRHHPEISRGIGNHARCFNKTFVIYLDRTFQGRFATGLPGNSQEQLHGVSPSE
jgi:hypothetical protein